MKNAFRNWLFAVLMAGFVLPAGQIQAQAVAPQAAPPEETPAAPAEPAPAEPAAAEAPQAPDAPEDEVTYGPRGRAHRENGATDRIAVGSNATLARGESANTVVSVFGSSTSEGDVTDAVVSVMGDTRVTGTTGDAIAVLGSVYLNGKASGDVVAVMGGMELGPQAEVGGDVVVVGGQLKRDPAAIVHGEVQNVMALAVGSFERLRQWARECLLYLRPLAIAPGLGWAWGVALAFLAVYLLIALLFRDAVDRSVRVFETQPGKSIVAAILSVLLTPVMFAVLLITVIGIAFIPIVALGLFLVSLFGKAVMLAWIGRCGLRLGGQATASVHAVFAVLIGGIVTLALYLVPFAGFIVYTTLNILGLGVAFYALALATRQKRGDIGPPPAAASVGPGGASATFTEPTIETPVSGSAPQSTSAGGPGASSAGLHEGSASPGAETPASSGAGAEPGASGAGPVPPGASGGAAAARPRGIDPAAALTYPRAGFAVRMGALLIDVILVTVLLGIITDSSTEAELIVLAAYGAIMWKLKSTTIGGIVFGLQVVRVDGRPIDWATAAVRALSCFLSLVIAGLGFIWIAFDEERQAWHDKIAGTVVVRVPKGVSLL